MSLGFLATSFVTPELLRIRGDAPQVTPVPQAAAAAFLRVLVSSARAARLLAWIVGGVGAALAAAGGVLLHNDVDPTSLILWEVGMFLLLISLDLLTILWMLAKNAKALNTTIDGAAAAIGSARAIRVLVCVCAGLVPTLFYVATF